MVGGLRTRSGRVVVAQAALLGALVCAGTAHAGNYDKGSLASEFLQSKTQATILSHDDEAAPNCHEKHFIKATPTVMPTVRTSGGVAERKWQEQWTLDRCGSQVSYYIFITEVGKGGAYYSIVDPPKTEVASDGGGKAVNQ